MATELGINRATLYSVLRRAGVQSRYRILNEQDVTIARQMYEAGQSFAAIGEHLGVGVTCLNEFPASAGSVHRGEPSRDERAR